MKIKFIILKFIILILLFLKKFELIIITFTCNISLKIPLRTEIIFI